MHFKDNVENFGAQWSLFERDMTSSLNASLKLFRDVSDAMNGKDGTVSRE